MDRNLLTLGGSGVGSWVALRKESVDRNNTVQIVIVVVNALSLSARRAWIEIVTVCNCFQFCLSLSARRAWIEIDFAGSAWVSEFRRSPQGERG